MKKINYIFITIITTLALIIDVNAITRLDNFSASDLSIAPNSCSNNLLKLEFTDLVYNNPFYRLDDADITNDNQTYMANNYLIEIEPNTKYYFYKNFIGSINLTIYYYTDEFKLSSEKQNSRLYDNGSFTTPSNAKYIHFTEYTSPSNAYLHMNTYVISKSDSETEYITYEECNTSPEPEVPEDEPTITPDSTLDNFYSIFLDKLKALSNFSLENKFILSAICIVLVLICLEFLIYLFKGGRWR